MAKAEGFKKWNFDHCIGAIDGKHIAIYCPEDAGSFYFNYKGTHSIVLMAVVDANYEFVYVDVGCNGRVSDGGVWSRCSLNTLLEQGQANLPDDAVLPGSKSGKKVPFMFVGDDAFPLKRYLMKPFPFRDQTEQQRIYSYLVSRARRVSENAFGILCAKWGVFRSRIHLPPKTVEKLVLACTAMHNKFIREQSDLYNSHGTTDREDITEERIIRGSWRDHASEALPLQRTPRNAPREAKDVREELTRYFNDEGAVPWQRFMSGLAPLE